MLGGSARHASEVAQNVEGTCLHVGSMLGWVSACRYRPSVLSYRKIPAVVHNPTPRTVSFLVNCCHARYTVPNKSQKHAVCTCMQRLEHMHVLDANDFVV